MTGRPVVAATDGSEDSLQAVEWASREAVLYGVRLRIVPAASLSKMVVLPLKPERDAVLGFVRDYRDRALAAAAARAAEIGPGPADRHRSSRGHARPGGHRQRTGRADAGHRLPRHRRLYGDGLGVGRPVRG